MPIPPHKPHLASSYEMFVAGSRDFHEIELLFNTLYPWKPVPAGFARWRYADRTVRGVCLAIRDRDQKTLVAAHGLQLLRAASPKANFLAALSVDVMVHPAHQRRGLGTWIEERICDCARAEGCAVILCFPNPKLAALRLRIPDWTFLCNARAMRSSSLLLDPPREANVNSALPAGADRIWDLLLRSSPDTAGIIRDRSFLEWRFFRNPVHAYECIALESSGQPSGICVTKLWTDPDSKETWGDIVEFLCPTDAGAQERLLRETCAYLQSRGAIRVTLWAPATLHDSVLHRLQFHPDPPRCRLLQVRYLVSRSGVPIESWYLTQADTDLY